jgi:lipopolysaccharide transport system ATP-binding protein
MGKPEIRQKLDEIIAFSEVEKFIDTPVKRYSSGMYVRLAFAVAAHLEPEILVVDEVLAVGDAQFQKKCLGKMQEVSREGRTVLFVSHNMRAVRSLCKSAILLDNGGITIHSSVDKAVETYLKVNNCGLLKDAIKRKISNLPEDQDFKLLDICMYQNNSEVETYVCNGSPLELQISFLVKRDVRDLLIFIRLCDQEENFIFHSVSGGCNESLADFSHGEYKARLTIPDNYLAPRNYLLQIGASIYKKRRCLPEWLGVNLNVVQTGCVDRACPDIAPGLLLPQLPWEVVRL